MPEWSNPPSPPWSLDRAGLPRGFDFLNSAVFAPDLVRKMPIQFDPRPSLPLAGEAALRVAEFYSIWPSSIEKAEPVICRAGSPASIINTASSASASISRRRGRRLICFWPPSVLNQAELISVSI